MCKTDSFTTRALGPSFVLAALDPTWRSLGLAEPGRRPPGLGHGQSGQHDPVGQYGSELQSLEPSPQAVQQARAPAAEGALAQSPSWGRKTSLARISRTPGSIWHRSRARANFAATNDAADTVINYIEVLCEHLQYSMGNAEITPRRKSMGLLRTAVDLAGQDDHRRVGLST